MKKTFASDNYSGILPEIIESIIEANKYHEFSYGKDKYTDLAIKEFRKNFAENCEVTFVFNGTAANVLGIACAIQSFNAILCPENAHIYIDESTAPETFTSCRLYPLAINAEGKIEIETLKKAIIRQGDEHHPQIKLLSISQPTEYGTVYTIEELKNISTVLKQHNMLFHVDGARLFNAATYLKCTLKEMTKDVGIDILSVGGTKIGLMLGEAVVFFKKELCRDLKYKQKQSMQLYSKMRFISCQFYELLSKKLWIKSALHSNMMAQKLYEGFRQIPEIKITKNVQTNVVFAILPAAWIEKLQSHTFFYVWKDSTCEVRLMCSFDTKEEEISNFIEKVKSLT